MARDRIRAGTMGAEDVLHDLGVIPITSSDAQGMGRAGETVRPHLRPGREDEGRARPRGRRSRHDNARVLRYLAKLTVNPAVAHGLAHEVGSLEVGKLADVVLWHPARFGAKPQLVLKAGFPAYGVTGDPNAAVSGTQPTVIGPQFGGHGAAPADLSVAFVSAASIGAGADLLPTRRRRVAVRGTRGIGLVDMVRNSRTADVTVDVRTGAVAVDGEPAVSPAAESVALARLYHL